MKNLFTCLSKKSLSNGNGSGMDREWIGNGSVCSRKLFASIIFLSLLGVSNAWGVVNGDLFERISAAPSANDEVIFVNQAETYACGTTQNTNNRTPVAITTSSNQYIYNSSNSVQVFVVKTNTVGSVTIYGFHTGSGYIYSASSSNNYLKTNSTSASTAPTTTSAWSLSFSSNVLTAQNRGNTAYYLAFNGTSYFSQYKKDQSKPYLYKKVMSAPTAVAASSITTSGATITITDATNVKYYELYYSTSSTAPSASTTATTTITNAKTKSITGLTANTRYYLWARAYSTSPARKTGWKALTGTYFTTLAASCSADPTIGAASLNGSFNLTTVGVQCASITPGTNCSVASGDYGFIWYANDGTKKEIGGSGVTKVAVTSGAYSSGSFSANLTKSSFELGTRYSVRAFATNGKPATVYSDTITFQPRSVTFNLNGHGSSTPSVQYVNNGGKASDPSYSESVTGYTFSGWYKEAGCSNAWTFASDAVSGENKTLYAKWTAKTYTIDLDQDLTPTSAGTTSITATYNSNSNLTSAITKPTKTGWTFAGYFTAKNGGGTQIIGADGNVIASVSGYTDASKNWIKASGVTLYAKWTCTVTWSVSGATDVYSAQTLTYNASSTKIASVPGPPSPASYCGDKFVGWTTEANVSQDDDDGLVLFTTVAGSPELKTVGNTTFYAVFADYDE